MDRLSPGGVSFSPTNGSGGVTSRLLTRPPVFHTQAADYKKYFHERKDGGKRGESAGAVHYSKFTIDRVRFLTAPMGHTACRAMCRAGGSA